LSGRQAHPLRPPDARPMAGRTTAAVG
jgi:hypothetical protein